MVLVPRNDSIRRRQVIYQSLQNQLGHLEKLIDSVFGGLRGVKMWSELSRHSDRSHRFTPRRYDHGAVPPIPFTAREAGHFVAIVINWSQVSTRKVG
jgi:hypothetical protein